MREFLKGLELDKETIDTIMAEYGKNTQGLREELDQLKTQKNTADETIKKFEDMDIESIKNELQSYKDKEAKRIAEEESAKKDALLNERITKAFGESQFINELTKKALINEMKKAIDDETNAGKSDTDIFNELTKDQKNIFANPNQPAEIPPMGDVEAKADTSATPMFW